MRNVQLTIAYQGTDFFGWQKTDTGPSIEGVLQQVLEKIVQHTVELQAASRTDAGVHALSQVVNFKTTREPLDLLRLRISLNQLLPGSIAVLEAHEMPEDFHATLDCKGKTYEYTVCTGTYQLPQHRICAWHYPHELDVELMQNSIPVLLGDHDFKAFCNQRKNRAYKDYERHLEAIEIELHPYHRMTIQISGNQFLYKMVRNIVGTLVYVGRGKIEVEQVGEILKGLERTDAGPTAPAHGLTLLSVRYLSVSDPFDHQDQSKT